MEDSIPLSSHNRPAKASATSMAVRTRAAGIHLSISVLVTAGVFAAMIALWYPWPVFLAAGAPELLLLVSVARGARPCADFSGVPSGKRSKPTGRDRDAQLSALGYGAHGVHRQASVHGFAVDRFELVSEADIEPEQLAKARPVYRELSITGPRLVAAELPGDAGERSTLLMAAATQGIDLKHLPQHYSEYEVVRTKGLSKSMPVDKLRDYNDPARVEQTLSELARAPQSLRITPARCQRDLTVFVGGHWRDPADRPSRAVAALMRIRAFESVGRSLIPDAAPPVGAAPERLRTRVTIRLEIPTTKPINPAKRHEREQSHLDVPYLRMDLRREARPAR
jgi:hypothetical protein